MTTPAPYVNHVTLGLDGARFGHTMSEMRWTPECHCTVVEHPAGPVWVAGTVDRTCGQHQFGERWIAE